jgi:UDP-N-acetylmuramoyl-tripeptide--D-alanyl-D-alanine ligase
MMSLCLGPTFWPPEGINTPMGITRLIREKLNSSHKYAVIEMGAYKEGSIKRLCDLTPVNAGIVTAVHLMHLERMGSEEQIYKAKSELPQAVPNNGILVVNGDNAGARKMATEFRKETTLVYGLDKSKGELDVYLDEIKFDRGGTNFSISYNGVSYKGFTRMHGRGSLSNICACFALMSAIGINAELILASLRDIRSVKNRLEVADYKTFIQINDAYNSNPMGFRYALEVLRDLPGLRKVLITPGMIELGDKVYDENKAVAIEAGKVCDLIILVNETNKKAFFDGLEEIKYPKDQIKWFLTRDEALAFYKEMQAEGDVLLLENDLPDLQEFKEIF